MADKSEKKSAKMNENTTMGSGTNSNDDLSSSSSHLSYSGYTLGNGYPNYDSYLHYPDWSSCGGFEGYQGQGYQQYQACEERGCWRKLYDYQTGHWYYQNLWTNTTQWTAPDGWESWPLNGQQENSEDSVTSSLSKFRRTSEEIEKKNSEYIKRPARRQVEPEEAKKIHWRPEGANEYNIWYDRWIGDHWKGTKNDGRMS